MAILTVAAHCIDDEFRETLKAAGVAIIDESGAPWEWKFEGPRDVLRRLLFEHWLIADSTRYITGD